MRIEIIDINGNGITDFELESNPFKVGEQISLSITNHDQSFWNIEERRGDFKIDNIEHYLRKEFTRNHKVSTLFTVSVEVTEIIYP